MDVSYLRSESELFSAEMDKFKQSRSIGDRPPIIQAAHLRQVLDVMFPHSYIKLYHRPPYSVCSIFSLKSAGDYDEEASIEWQFKASSEPSSRVQVISLQEQLRDSLSEHRAKPTGLCPKRRAIYDQCFDELIRQVTVGCIEQGLLLFQVRNELRLTISYYRRAYESAIFYGLRKALDSRIKLDQYLAKIDGLEKSVAQHESKALSEKAGKSSLMDEIDQANRIESYYQSEIAKKDEIIKQQRNIIKLLGEK